MALLPFLLLGATLIALGLQYDSLPDSLVAHWGPKGPDRWVPRSWRSVFGVPLVGMAVLAVLTFAQASIGRAPAETDWHVRYRAFHSRILSAIMYCLALVFCNMALAPIGDPARAPIPFWVSIAPTGLVVMWGLWQQAELQSETGVPAESKLRVPNQWVMIAAACLLPLLIWFLAP